MLSSPNVTRCEADFTMEERSLLAGRPTQRVVLVGAQVPESVLGDHSYHGADVHQWTSDISSQCLKQLKGVASGNAGFKFVGECASSILFSFHY